MKIGFIGLGIMGEGMSKNIVQKHDDHVYVYDRNIEKVQSLIEAGAIPCSNSKEVAHEADIIISMVPTSQDSASLYEEIEKSLTAGKIAIDMSTIDPDISMKIANKLRKKKVLFFDAPVVKSRPAAEKGELGIYVGGEETVFPIIQPILSYMGKNIIYMGNQGKGLVMKICHNALVAQIQNGVNETLLLAQKNGISISDFVKAISYGGGQNFYLDGKAKAIEQEDYTTAFSIQNMKKDLDILQRLETKHQVFLPGAAVTRKIYQKAMEYGYEKEDFSATYKVVRKEALDEKES